MKAAEQVCALAQCSLAQMYGMGRGVPQDEAQAVAWMKKAAAGGHADAQYLLGLSYETGCGVRKDNAQAVALWAKAAAQGHQSATAVMMVLFPYGWRYCLTVWGTVSKAGQPDAKLGPRAGHWRKLHRDTQSPVSRRRGTHAARLS